MFETSRFFLKKLSVSEANENYLNWFSDKNVKQFIINHPTSVRDLVTFINKCNDDDSILLLGVFVKNSSHHIGNIKFEFEGNSKIKAVMGIMIGDSNWRGKGVASEVIYDCGFYLKKEFDTKIMRLGVDKLNLPAINVYKNIGFIEDIKTKVATSGLFMNWTLP